MLDPIYRMRLKSLKIAFFGVKHQDFVIFYAVIMNIINFTKSVNQCFIDFIAWH